MEEREKLEHELKAKNKEMRKISAMMGKLEKREKEKDEKIRRLQKERNALESLYLKVRKELELSDRTCKRVAEENAALSQWYAGIIAYLVSEFVGGSLSLRDAYAWLERYEYKISENTTKDVWEVTTREVKDNEHESGGPAAEDAKTG